MFIWNSLIFIESPKLSNVRRFAKGIVNAACRYPGAGLHFSKADGNVLSADAAACALAFPDEWVQVTFVSG